MVRIVDYQERSNSEGEKFFTLTLQGGLEMVKSQESGRFYATAKTSSVTSTFNEEACKALIGQELPGEIQKVICEPYEYTIKDTGEVLTLEHRWEYFKEGESPDESVKTEERERKPQTIEDFVNA